MDEKQDAPVQELKSSIAGHDLKPTASHDPKDGIQFEEAKNATNREHELSLNDALKLYPKAIAYSLLFSTAIIMEGYDLALMGSLYGFTECVSTPFTQSPAWRMSD